MAETYSLCLNLHLKFTAKAQDLERIEVQKQAANHPITTGKA
jgi:hypothetical protein